MFYQGQKVALPENQYLRLKIGVGYDKTRAASHHPNHKEDSDHGHIQIFLYRAFGLKDVHHEATQYIQDTIIFKARMSSLTIKCPHCGSREATFKDQKRRLLYSVP